MSIYMVQMGEGGPMRVGFTDNPKVRIASYSGAWPYDPIVWAILPGSREHESALHWHLASEHIRSEWFRASHKTLTTALDLVAGRLALIPRRDKFLPRYVPNIRCEQDEAQEAIRAIFAKMGGPTRVGVLLGHKACPSFGRIGATSATWLTNGRIPEKHWDALIAAAAGVGVTITRDELAAIPRLKRKRQRKAA
jgi:hypothetical protein